MLAAIVYLFYCKLALSKVNVHYEPSSGYNSSSEVITVFIRKFLDVLQKLNLKFELHWH